ncbi:hypothetical protein E2N92_05640 [Methanofollis formosanus]|uniref:Uncharacterized protein n=1 Tax=Methanofollis formosanus TaxID=299308 RepID=A0A8G1A2M1_9EURY|nr:hypothetical protein [Methanofollis formosanus]QYZ78942.1 hypothetical protein E2N92_05640 [Methanofollis formosanus]
MIYPNGTGGRADRPRRVGGGDLDPCEPSFFRKPWLTLWFSVQCRYPDPPGQYTLACTLHDLVGAVKETFDGGGMSAGTCGRRAPKFRTKVKGTDDPCTVEYLILPRASYSLRDLAAERRALVVANRMLASRSGARFRTVPLACLGYDDAGEPVGRLSFGPLSVRYLMRDRVRSGIDDLFFDKFYFYETVFEAVSRLKHTGLSEYAAGWVTDVEAVIDEELARGGCDRRTIERRAREVDNFLRGVHRRHRMPRVW